MSEQDSMEMSQRLPSFMEKYPAAVRDDDISYRCALHPERELLHFYNATAGRWYAVCLVCNQAYLECDEAERTSRMVGLVSLLACFMLGIVFCDVIYRACPFLFDWIPGWK